MSSFLEAARLPIVNRSFLRSSVIDLTGSGVESEHEHEDIDPASGGRGGSVTPVYWRRVCRCSAHDDEALARGAALHVLRAPRDSRARIDTGLRCGRWLV